jgi:RNA:NAD 2'-phosphotransferase (TPT1/KptA family)
MDKVKVNWMSYHLRHNANILTDPSGWVTIKSLASLSPEVTLTTDQKIEKIMKTVNNDKKNRFIISSDSAFIRATNGHSVDLTNPVMRRITSDDIFPWVIHATTKEAWSKIQEYGSLSRMSRDYVHFAIIFPHLRSSDVYLYFDIQSFINDGNELWMTTNRVLASMVDVPIRYLSVGSRPNC